MKTKDIFFNSIQKNKGISLITLVITIIVIIILAGAVLLTLVQTNVIENANEAVFKQDLDNFKSELLLYKYQKYADNLGNYDSKKLNADADTLTYGDEILDGNITTIIPQIENKYPEEFEIVEGELVYKGQNPDKEDWSEETGVQVSNEEINIQIYTSQDIPVKAGAHVEYTINFLAKLGINSINLTGKVKIIDMNGVEIAIQPTIAQGEVNGTSGDKIWGTSIDIDTQGIAEGEYKVKVLDGAVMSINGKTNPQSEISIQSFIIDNTAPNKPSFETVPTNLTNWVSNIQVSIIPADPSDRLEYNLDGSTTYISYSNPILITDNLTVYAREIDIANNESNISTLEINKIDKIIPQSAIINATSLGDTINANLTLSDNEMGIDFSKSKYIINKTATVYDINNTIWNTPEATIITGSPSNISKSGLDDDDYYIQVLSVDRNNNKKVNISSKSTITGIIDPGYVPDKGVNGPVLKTGMTPIKWNGADWVTTTYTDPDWYSYGTTQETRRWANARTADGSFWVWIPRYEYRISTPHSSTPQEIAINFIQNKNTQVTSGYILHPAFTFGTEELTGIWVAKFEATAREGVGDSNGSDNVTTKNVKIIPNAKSWRYIQIGNMFDVCRRMESDSTYGWGTKGIGIDTHLMKNIEWGAAAYMSRSRYGKNAEIWINSDNGFITGKAGTSASSLESEPTYSYSTPNGIQASTTGNVYGIYDMSGGALEYVAAYVNNGNGNISNYGGNLTNPATDSKYRDVYVKGANDDYATNYSASSARKGDAVYEISTNGEGSTTSWYGDYSYMPYSNSVFFSRGGFYYSDVWAGIFAFNGNAGSAYMLRGFRPVLVYSML